jgi:hypothetical protein
LSKRCGRGESAAITASRNRENSADFRLVGPLDFVPDDLAS